MHMRTIMLRCQMTPAGSAIDSYYLKWNIHFSATPVSLLKVFTFVRVNFLFTFVGELLQSAFTCVLGIFFYICGSFYICGRVVFTFVGILTFVGLSLLLIRYKIVLYNYHYWDMINNGTIISATWKFTQRM